MIREQLKAYVHDIHQTIMPLEMSLYEVYGAILELGSLPDIEIHLADVDQLTKDGVNRLALLVMNLDRAQGVLGPQWYKNPWQGILGSYLEVSQKRDLQNKLQDAIRISCGIGIHTGEITLSKVGMKGKEKQEDAEDEFGIAWIGNSTNLACKFSGAVGNGTIFISPSTYSALTDVDGKQMWKWSEIAKGNNILKGYVAKQYYLQLDDEIIPCIAEESKQTLSLVDELKREYKKQLAEIEQKSVELGRKEQSLLDKENQVNKTLADVNRKTKEVISKEESLNKQAYHFFLSVLGSGHCKAAYVVEMGQKFWEDNLNELILAGAKIGKDEHTVKQEISYAMVSIYQSLDKYDKAYDFLVEQAAGYAWLLLHTVQDIVPKVGYCERLKSALYKRLGEEGLSAADRAEFTKIKDWLVFEYLR